MWRGVSEEAAGVTGMDDFGGGSLYNRVSLYSNSDCLEILFVDPAGLELTALYQPPKC